jgi:hypothetical protein
MKRKSKKQTTKPAKLQKSNTSESTATLINEPFDFDILKDDLTTYLVVELKGFLDRLVLDSRGKVSYKFM